MKDNSKKYWKGIEELSNDPTFIKNSLNEFPDFVPLKEQSSINGTGDGSGRRDFLKLLGFGVAAVSLAACEAPVNKVIPYVNKPEEVDPGIANWYASTYQKGGDYCAVIVKTREGRPIKIEGNSLCPITKGGTSARVQASVLSLYDSTKLRNFTLKGSKAKQEEVDNQIISKLNKIQNSNGNIRIISNTIISPSTKSVISDFISKFPVTKHIQYDGHSVSGLIKANKVSFGKAIIPSYNFSAANIIVSFGADFLGNWISPIEYATQYGANKKLGKSRKSMLKHYQVESNLSLTGSNADYRLPIKPSQEGLYIAALYNKISNDKINVSEVKSDLIDRMAKDLLANKGNSLVVSGSNDISIQILINKINTELGNYGKSIDLNIPSFQKQGDDTDMYNFVQEVKAGQINGIIFYGCNPGYDFPLGAELIEGLQKAELSVSFSDKDDETATFCQYVCPDLHFLESWNDAEPKKGYYSLTQPTITPIFKETRSAQESLLLWTGKKQDYYSYLVNFWQTNILKSNSQSTWDKTLQDGVYKSNSSSSNTANISSTAAFVASSDTLKTQLLNSESSTGPIMAQGDLNSLAEAISRTIATKNDGIEVKFYEKIGIGTGADANNPWLQELPDPISKATWDNYVAMPQKYAKANNFQQGDLVSVSINGKQITKSLPVIVQPGQANDTISIAIGYGRIKAGKCGNNVGVNVFPYITYKNGTFNYDSTNVAVKKSGGRVEIAQTQTHHTIMARPIIQDSTLEEYIKDPYAGRFRPLIHTFEGHAKPEEITAWSGEHNKPNHLWGMVIDLNSCIGCNACVIGCQSENNIAVVGKDEVVNRREMHWLRIDRYYSSNAEVPEKGSQKYFERDPGSSNNDLEEPSENPQVTFQPMLCQHCNHAPCETVCPVAATTHSSEGLNQMAYNRCIGTRYCANNCPYKVRRFNWFKYYDNDKFPDNTSMNDALGKMVLNPDVTVRSRGVMEKCSFCVQRIQEGKLTAKKEKRRPIDGEIKTACASACPTQAITFGDMNDVNSQIHFQLNQENKERAYHVLEEINTQPNISYLTKIRNINKV